MKRIIPMLAAAAVTLMPLTALAATISAGEQYSLPTDTTVIGNLYVAAGTSTFGGRVTGDVFAVGGTLAMTGTVGGDIAAGGGTIQVLGAVNGDVRAVGGTITINERVAGDLVVAGGSVHVLPNATIGGDVLIAGGQVTIDGVVNGAVKTVGGMLTINGNVRGPVDATINERLVLGSGARVGGVLAYSAPAEATIADGAVIAGGISYEPRAGIGAGSQKAERAAWGVLQAATGLQMIMTLVLAALLVWRWKRTSLDILLNVHRAYWPSLGRGLAYLILVPIAAILLLISFVGVLPGIIVLLGYAILCILASALAGMLVGSVVVMLARKRTFLDVTWGSALGGVVALELVGLIPVIGWLIGAAAWLAVFGVLAHRTIEGATRA